MSEKKIFTLQKEERLNSKIIIEKLFSGGSKSLPAFPLRIVYMPVEEESLPTISLLISVPKKKFKRAVKRNRVKADKRSLQEKQIYTERLSGKGEQESRNSIHLAWK